MSVNRDKRSGSAAAPRFFCPVVARNWPAFRCTPAAMNEMRRRQVSPAQPQNERVCKDVVEDSEDVVPSWPRFIGSWLYTITVVLFYSFWFIVGLLVIKKTQTATAAVRYIKHHGDSVAQNLIEASPDFQQLIHVLDTEFDRPPAFLLLNQHALNMTYNFLCNTASLPGVHERLIFVTLDSEARDKLRQRWPKIRQFYWPTPCLYVSFTSQYLYSNLVYLESILLPYFSNFIFKIVSRDYLKFLIMKFLLFISSHFTLLSHRNQSKSLHLRNELLTENRAQFRCFMG